MSNKPEYNVCVAKRIAQDRNKMVQVGSGWVNHDGVSMRLSFDLTFIITPEDTLFVFPKETEP